MRTAQRISPTAGSVSSVEAPRGARSGGLPSGAGTVPERWGAVVALEGPREVERVPEAHAEGDLPHAELREGEQTRRLGHHALADQRLGSAPGDVHERPR